MAMLPWWVGVALALVSYVILHQLAAAPAVVAVKPGQIAELRTRTMGAGLASPGQFFLPFLCILGAIGSFIRRKKRAALVSGGTLGVPQRSRSLCEKTGSLARTFHESAGRP